MTPHPMSLTIFRSITAGAALSALAACAPAAPPTGIQAPMAMSDKACLSQEWTPLLPSSQSPPYRLLAGGTVTSNEFIIGIWLYCDPSLTATDAFAEDYSEIGGLGLHYEWLYRGPSSDSSPKTSVTVNDDETRGGGSGPGLQSGDAEASTGPIETPSRAAAIAAAAGQPIVFTVRIDVGGSLTTASLTVLLQPFPEGYRLSTSTFSAPD